MTPGKNEFDTPGIKCLRFLEMFILGQWWKLFGNIDLTQWWLVYLVTARLCSVLEPNLLKTKLSFSALHGNSRVS